MAKKGRNIKVHFTFDMNEQGVTKAGKYLGVTISPNQTWNKITDIAVKKAIGSRAFLQRNLRQWPRGIKELEYETLVRPIIEYTFTLWAPFWRTHNVRVCLYIAYIACGSASLCIKTLYFFLARTEEKATTMYWIVNDLIATPLLPHCCQDVTPISYPFCTQKNPTSHLNWLLQILLPISRESLEQYRHQCCPDQHHR